MHAGKKIRIIRAIRNLSQSELAEKIGRTRALISHIEQTGKINYYTLKDILKVFKMSEDEFDNYEPKEMFIQYSEEDLRNQIQALRQEIETVKKERDMLKEHNDLYRKLLNSLEKQKGGKDR